MLKQLFQPHRVSDGLKNDSYTDPIEDRFIARALPLREHRASSRRQVLPDFDHVLKFLSGMRNILEAGESGL